MASKLHGSALRRSAVLALGLLAFAPARPLFAEGAERPREVNPCNTPDPGFGSYDPWTKNVSLGLMLAPARGGVSANGEFDLVIHFHGHDPARKEWVQVMHGPVLVGMSLGVGSGAYENAFRDEAAFAALVRSVEQAMAEKTGKKNARARRIALSAWSAGYGAIRQILQQPLGKQRVDAVILLDGLHCDYLEGKLVREQLAPFVEFARQAATGKRFMLISHSSIVPPGYASTTETADFLVRELGGKARRVSPRPNEPHGLALQSRFDRGAFHVRGYAGNAQPDHCAQIGLYRDVLKVHLLPRWNPPRAKKR